MRTLLPLVLAACAVDVPDDAPRPPPASTLALTLVGQPIPGQPLGWEVTGAQPGEVVYVLVGNGGLGRGVCPPFLGGNCMDFRGGALGYQLAGAGPADATGTFAQQGPFPAGVPAGTYQVQAVTTGPNANESDVEQLLVAPSCPADPYEPNDDPSTATASVAPLPDGRLCWGEEDWFAYTVPPDGYVEVTIDMDLAEGDLDAELVDPAGDVLDVAATARATEVLAWFNPSTAPVTVFARLIPFLDPGQDGVPYAIRAETITPGVCTEDPAEDDDDAGAATPLVPGDRAFATACPADADWFSVEVPAGETLFAEVAATPGGGDVVVQVHDATLTPRGVPADEVTYTAGAGAAETVWLEATLASDDAVQPGNSYQLDVDVRFVAVCLDDAYEPDDTRAQAHPIAVGTTAGLTACVGSDPDFFSVTLAAGDVLEVTADFAHTDGDLDLWLVDPRGRWVASSTGVTDGETITWAAASPGAHTVMVTLYAEAGGATLGGAPYALVVGVN